MPSSNPLHRTRRGTIWYYAGLGVSKAAIGLLLLIAVALLAQNALKNLPHTPPPPQPSPSSTPSPSPTITVQEVELPYPVETTRDEQLPVGETRVVQQGVNGVKRIVYRDGKEETVTVIKQPVAQIVAIGASVPPAPVQTVTATPTTSAPKTTTATRPTSSSAAPPPPQPQPAVLTVKKTITCTTDVTLSVTPGGNYTAVTVTGPASTSGTGSVVVEGGAGQYVATVTGTAPKIGVTWLGTCSSS